MTEKVIRLAAKLYDARDHVKLLLGDAYAMRMRDGGKLLTGVAKSRGCGVLEVATEMARLMADEDKPFAAMAIIAAAVELLEPSTA